MILHIVNKSPHHDHCFADCLQICRANDSVLLIEEGVYAAVANTASSRQIVDKKIRAYALQADVSARGLQNCISKDVLCISDEEFVALTVEYSTVQSWY